MIKYAHLINPYGNGDRIQEITLASMCDARRNFSNPSRIHFFTTTFSNDSIYISGEFQKLPYLERSVSYLSDSNTLVKLPFIGDQLALLKDIDVDYIVYTNMDIHFKPDFYLFVEQQIHSGYDALIINRRRIPDKEYSVVDLPILYNILGKTHPGFDCFIFKRSLISRMRFFDICTGIPFFEASMVYTICSLAENPKFFPKSDCTFHIGMEIFKKRDKNLYWHNRNTFFKLIMPYLKDKIDLNKLPWGNMGFCYRFYYWAKNPAIFTFLNFSILIKRHKSKFY